MLIQYLSITIYSNGLILFLFFSYLKTVDDVGSTQIDCNKKTMQHTKGTSYVKNVAGFTERKIFILQWIPTYSGQDFIGDFLAGITVGLTVIPQSMALAGIVGVPAQVNYNCKYPVFLSNYYL